MDISPLVALKGRWPADQAILSSTLDALHNVSDHLQIDKHDSQAISQFAAANNFAYAQRPAEPPVRASGYTPAWIRLPVPLNEPTYAHELTGIIDGYPVAMCLEYIPASTGQGDGKVQNLDKRSIIRVKLPKIFPQLVLDSNKNDRGLTSTIPNSIRSSQAITLEGDFADYFDLYVPLGIQVDALVLLAPNLMQLLKDSSASFDVEFYGAEIILVSREPIYTPEIMAQALQALRIELAYLSNLLTSWNYLPINKPFDTLEYSTLNGNIVKIGPLRLKPIALITLILIGFVLFSIAIALSK